MMSAAQTLCIYVFKKLNEPKIHTFDQHMIAAMISTLCEAIVTTTKYNSERKWTLRRSRNCDEIAKFN